MSLPVPQNRPLTTKELNCLRMLEAWELMVDDRRYFGAVKMTEDALDTYHALQIAQPFAEVRDRDTGTYEVRFDLIELHKYIIFACDDANVTENLDGTMTTHDGITVPIKFKQPPLYLKKESTSK